ncbi:Na(+)/H(+) antiporter NhaC [Collibacillus ludicampi]|uniref:Na(+)/H(+) antiporter NhaC n=1 Tax=Collibacillus ludicampi TaxID=2771369 RepID=A0AAV4LDA5_9BACL|nr:Na+/H+ antiporter NhaC family protein [Collibacillus ludicampi]GIM45767.1 Na(+)/H(+) antiporter NhaC [Collibacillus ludicampi]
MNKTRTVPLSLSVIPFLVSIAGLIAALKFINIPLYSGLAAGWLTAVVISLSHGGTFRSVVRATYQGMKSTFFVVAILLLIAGIISAWLASGTVPAMIFYGIQLIHPKFLVVTAFLLAAVSSMTLGSSVATLSTMGVAIADMAQVLNLSPALIGGALISGAMVGDRTSPVSGTFHLVAHMTETKAEENYKPMWQTGIPMVIVCILLYFFLGYGKVSGSFNPMNHPFLQELIRHFQMPWYVIIPPILVLVLAVFRVPIMLNLGVGTVLGIFFAVTWQGDSWLSVLRSLWLGYDLQVNGQVLLHGGGIWPMFNEVLLIVAAGALNGVMEESGMLHAILDSLLQRIHSKSGLIGATVLLSISMSLLACNQSLSVIVPGRTLRSTFEKLGVPSRYLVRSLADSGVVVSPLIPWNLHGILCSAAMSIPTVVYFPCAFFLWGLPILTLLLAFCPRRLSFKWNQHGHSI